jgi:hypothetical protein
MDLPRRLTGWRIARIFAGILVLFAGACALWIRSVANDQWSRMEARIAELEVDQKKGLAPRPVLRGDPIPGDAWDFYGSALSSVPKLPRPGTVDLYFRDKGVSPPAAAPATLTAMQAWAAPAAPALDQLRAGTHRAELRPTIQFDGRFTPLVVEIDRAWYGMWCVTRAGVVKAHELVDAGKGDEAVEVLLDLAQFGRDALQGTNLDGCRIGTNVLDLALGELRKLLASKNASVPALPRLARELEILDRGWPKGDETLRNQLLAFGKGCVQEEEQGSLMYRGYQTRLFRSWRWGYSSRFRAASTFLRADGFVRERIRMAEENGRWDVYWNPPPDWPDPVLSDAFGYASGDPGRGQRASLRLLRIAVHYQRTGEILDLPDPSGGRIKTSIMGSKLRAWSSGVDGVDNGGVGDGWNSGTDIVIEAER